ncbi:MAG: diguanylate cyclase [Ruminococcaceae bacterium]|nr:diguanylate cyclase [Oscillospiraceae bacterium]
MAAENHTYRILVVDDSLLNQQMLQHILQDDYAVKTAGTAMEAVACIQDFRPHLILLDIILPDANGLDILVALKEGAATRNIPVIIISGLDSDKDEEQGFLLGAVDYIRKPFKDAIVKARVNTQIRILKQIETIEQMGLMDALTGIQNRRAFDSQFQYEWGRAVREHGTLSLLMLDVDRFKAYNDTYGHPQGDKLLHGVAQTMRGTLSRSVDLVYRYGGEEFVVLLPGTGLEGAVAVAEKLRVAIKALRVPCGDTPTSVTASIGVASAQPQVGGTPQPLMEAADQMLYRAKENGRDQVQFDAAIKPV